MRETRMRKCLEASNREQLGVDCHADDGVRAQRVQRIDLLLAANAAGDDELARR